MSHTLWNEAALSVIYSFSPYSHLHIQLQIHYPHLFFVPKNISFLLYCSLSLCLSLAEANFEEFELLPPTTLSFFRIFMHLHTSIYLFANPLFPIFCILLQSFSFCDYQPAFILIPLFLNWFRGLPIFLFFQFYFEYSPKCEFFLFGEASFSLLITQRFYKIIKNE